jgi:hypothetical protein
VESLCQTCRGPHIQCNADLWMEAVLRHWLPSTNLDCSGQDGSSLGQATAGLIKHQAGSKGTTKITKNT